MVTRCEQTENSFEIFVFLLMILDFLRTCLYSGHFVYYLVSPL